MPAEIVFYTNQMSRGGIVHWMLEELGAPYRMEILECGTTMKAPEYLAIQSDGQGAGDQAWRRGGDRGGGDLRLPVRLLS